MGAYLGHYGILRRTVSTTLFRVGACFNLGSYCEFVCCTESVNRYVSVLNCQIIIYILKLFFMTAVSTRMVDYYLVCNEHCVPSPFREIHANASAIFNSITAQEEVVRSYVSSNHSSLLVSADVSTHLLLYI